ncbi:MAG: FAD-binding protein [Tepidanaerobacteraceae bacterium]|jgi:electron transfer flavoprotein alpha subunit
MSLIKIIEQNCTACGNCTHSCPLDAIHIDEGHAVISEDCNSCGMCIDACQADAIVKDIKCLPSEIQVKHLRQCSDIWVFAECRDGRPAQVVYELLGEARRKVTDSIHKVAAVLITDESDGFIEEDLINHGADIVYLVQGQIFEHFRDEPYIGVIEELVKEYKPLAMLFGATLVGRSLAPRLAARLKTGLSADCTSLELMENGILMQTRPAFGGNLFANIICPKTWPQLATVRPRVMKPIGPSRGRKGSVIKKDLSTHSLKVRTKVLQLVKQINEVSVEDAKIIVSAGLGVTDKKGLNLVKDLSKAFKGALGASRRIVDLGWVSSDCQIGQTGKTVCPDLYIACGISGAVQHIVGMRGSKMIVAINIDPDAPIFKIADIGLEGDLFEILPFMIEERNSLNLNFA